MIGTLNIIIGLIRKRLKKRIGFNEEVVKKFKEIQLPIAFKKKKSNFIIKNNFTYIAVKTSISNILKKIL
jgi:dephospho-CoA kinase